MKKFFLIAILFIAGISTTYCQQLDSLKREILKLNQRVNDIDLRMQRTEKQFKMGILVSTLGYTVTIAGGLMLGRERDQLGQVLLVAGGVTGATGTYILVDSFRALAGRKKKNPSP